MYCSKSPRKINISANDFETVYIYSYLGSSCRVCQKF